MSLNGPRKPIRRRNTTRANAGWVRAYGSPERVAFVQSLPCAACGVVPSECAHIVKGDGGASHKASAKYTGPLCAKHHALSHTMGVQSFAAAFDLDLPAVAARVDAEWTRWAA